MVLINPGVLKRQLISLFLFLVAHIGLAQEIQQPIVKFSHPSLSEINHLVATFQYEKAISLSLKKARQMRNESNWEGYLAFMLRAAEIETFEVWKARSHPEIDIQPDYRRAIAYLDSLYKFGAGYLESYPYLKADVLFTSAVAHDWLNRVDTAEQMHRTALDLRTKLFGKTSREVADSYLWMGVLYNWGLNRKDWAKQYYEKALELQKQYMPQSRYALGTAYYGLSILARENYDLDEAVAMTIQYAMLYDDLPYEQAFGYELTANHYGKQGNYEKALQKRLEAIQIYQRQGFYEELIQAYTALADDLARLERHQEALQALGKAMDFHNKSKDKNLLFEKSLNEKLGEIYHAVKQYDSAEVYLNKALQNAISHFGTHNEESAVVYGLRGKLYIEQNKFKEAIGDYQQMLTSVIPDFSPKNIYAVPEIQKESPYFFTIITALFNKGDAMLKWFQKEQNPDHLRQALVHYRAAYNQLMEARKTIGDELSKPLLMQNFETSIEQSIQCAKRLHDLTGDQRLFQDIFHFIELTKYLNVLDALQRAERANNSGVPKSLLFELEDVRNELSSLQKKKLTAVDAQVDSLNELNERILSLIEPRRNLMAEISSYPDRSVPGLQNILLNLDDVRENLSSEEQVIEYFWGTDSVYALSITSDNNTIASIGPLHGMDSLFAYVYQHMSGNYSFKKEDVKKFSDKSSLIYKTFFAPLIHKPKLIIIPDGPLSVLPADALVVDPNPEADSYNTLDYAIYHHETSYAYSASILFKEQHVRSRKIENVLAFSYSNGMGGPSIALRNQQNDLPGTYRELEALSRLFRNVRRFTDNDASKSNFIKNTIGSDVIHLGIHGIGDEGVEDNSRLIFRKDSLDDAELYAYEIYNLDLTAGLVVLSACESGLGRNQKGEGIFSIARAFTYAGCPASVMSLWKARDVFTAEIMVQFYENLSKGASVSNSLRNAKLQFLKDVDGPTAHPANWAAFVLNGQDVKFAKSRTLTWVYSVVIASLFLSVIILYWKKKKGY